MKMYVTVPTKHIVPNQFIPKLYKIIMDGLAANLNITYF